jgi:hypothetical protein
MDEEVAPANQRIDDMFFKGLTDWVTVAMQPNSAKTAKTPVKTNEPKAAAREKTAKSKKP